MIVCFCHRLTEADVARFRSLGIRDWKSLARLTKAGSRCRPCRRELVRLLSPQNSISSGEQQLDCLLENLQKDHQVEAAKP